MYPVAHVGVDSAVGADGCVENGSQDIPNDDELA
jgi:hypothetical protein